MLLINSLTNDHLVALKADIDSKMNLVLPNGKTMAINLGETNFDAIALYYNTAKSPVVNVWRPDINPKEMNKGLVMTEFQALSVQKQNGWFAMIGGNEVDATITLTRTNFGTIFGGASATAINLTAIAQKPATNFEGLFVSSGSTSVYGYMVTFADIDAASRIAAPLVTRYLRQKEMYGQEYILDESGVKKFVINVLLAPFFVVGVLWGHLKAGLEKGEAFYYKMTSDAIK